MKHNPGVKKLGVSLRIKRQPEAQWERVGDAVFPNKDAALLFLKRRHSDAAQYRVEGVRVNAKPVETFKQGD